MLATSVGAAPKTPSEAGEGIISEPLGCVENNRGASESGGDPHQAGARSAYMGSDNNGSADVSAPEHAL